MRPFVILVALAACGTAPEADTTSTPEATPTLEAAPPATLDLSAEAPATQARIAIPTLTETQLALDAAGLQAKLSEVGVGGTFDLTKTEPDRVAVRIGVQLAHLSLHALDLPTPDLIARLQQVEDGLVLLGLSDDVVDEVKQLIEELKAGSITREQVVQRLDQFSAHGVEALRFEGYDDIVPLIQAGVWLEGVHLVSLAALSADNVAAGQTVLKQPGVVAAFRVHAEKMFESGWVESEIVNLLRFRLAQLELAANTESWSRTELEAVQGATSAILEKL